MIRNLYKAGQLEKALDFADTVVIGAGAGLSASAGFVYDGERFKSHFSDFEDRYGFHDMYAGGFYPYSTAEEYWAYWNRYIYINRYIDAPKPVYNNLYKLIRNRDYFVITTNVDHCFQKAGFDKNRLFCTQGDYGLFQCSKPCCNETFDNESIIRSMVEQQHEMKIPSELIPFCPYCGRPLTVNLRSDDKFVENYGWHEAAARYREFIFNHRDSRVLFLELGVGYNTPAIIKYPFWKMTYQNPDAVYACINNGETFAPKEIAECSICLDEDIGDVLVHLLAGRESFYV